MNPPEDEMLMIFPAPCSRMTGRTARVIVSRPKTLTSKTARASASDTSSTALSRPRPALLTSKSIPPNRARVAETAVAA
jgi:hypothetical protein